MPQQDHQGVFIEQAEYIEDSEFVRWTVEHPHEETILRKLCQQGAKLLTGPRGCGKTTLLLKARGRLLDTRAALPIYVNYKSSLKLEPFYQDKANATYLFNQWMLLKIYEGAHEAAKELKLKSALALSAPETSRLARQLELGNTDDSHETYADLDVLRADLHRLLSEAGVKRCVVFLDDAAHAFSSQQQRDFFDLFRQLKSKAISPKAAIYPGVTVYPASFQVGHDAEEIDAWVKPNSADYLPFIVRLLEARLPAHQYRQLMENEPLLSFMCFGAFGMPRALLNMVRALDQETGAKVGLRFTRKNVLTALSDSFQSTSAVFQSLAIKLPMYETFVSVGQNVLEKIVDSIKQFNKGKTPRAQSTTIAIRKPIPMELSKVLGFFQYAGLLLPKGEISKGVKGVFELYVVHYAALIERNAVMAKKAININDYVTAFRDGRSHSFTRTSSKALLGDDHAGKVLSLSLPPCRACLMPRLTETSKFCAACGAQLKPMSVFESLVAQPIDRLNLTAPRVAKIKRHSSIKSIKDILVDHDRQELRKVPSVGPIWAGRIYNYAEEYIA